MFPSLFSDDDGEVFHWKSNGKPLQEFNTLCMNAFTYSTKKMAIWSRNRGEATQFAHYKGHFGNEFVLNFYRGNTIAIVEHEAITETSSTGRAKEY